MRSNGVQIGVVLDPAIKFTPGMQHPAVQVVEEFDARQEAKRLGVLIASSLGLAAKPPKRPGTELPRSPVRATP